MCFLFTIKHNCFEKIIYIKLIHLNKWFVKLCKIDKMLFMNFNKGYSKRTATEKLYEGNN